jgi:hypothetical protein
LRKLFNEKCVSVKQQLDVVLADFNTKYKETFKSAK